MRGHDKATAGELQRIGQKIRRQTLDGCECPSCHSGRLHLQECGTNVCDKCGYELITEWEWNRRQNLSEGS